MSYEDKVILYRAGRFLVPYVPMDTTNWLERDWIAYISKEGVWKREV